MSPAEEAKLLLQQLGVESGGTLESRSPIDGQPIGSVAEAGTAEVADACAKAQQAFLAWRTVPAPRRGELVRLLGEELRAAKEPLSRRKLFSVSLFGSPTKPLTRAVGQRKETDGSYHK